MIIKFWGTRGSIPVPGISTTRYGGNTPCIQVSCKSGEFIIIDAGTGIRELGNEIIKKNNDKNITIFISHTHWDHIQGLPFFHPLYNEDYNIIIHSNTHEGMTFDHIIEAQWHPVFFPVNKDILKANIKFKNIMANKEYYIGKLKVETTNAHHSKGTLSFKITRGTKSIVYMTDNEIKYNTKSAIPTMDSISENNSELINFCSNCDYLIHDTMYKFEDYPTKIGWGHSNNIAVAQFSILAKVKNLVIFHYEPEYSDNKIDELYSETKKILQEANSQINCIASSELLEIDV